MQSPAHQLTGDETHLFNLESVLPTERTRLVRFCTRYSSDPNVAEDLAQETLIEAWRNRHKLTDPQGYDKWLTAIAFNVCQRWARKQHRDSSRFTDLDADTSASEIPDPADFEIDLERDQLADLLDRAIALLPAETRQVLIARYLEEMPQSEVASRLNLTESAVAVRLHRGKLALRRILTSELDSTGTHTWQDTQIWCPQCGLHHLQGQFVVEKGEYNLRCPRCFDQFGGAYIEHVDRRGLLQGVKGFKPALSRILKWSETYYGNGIIERQVSCSRCKKMIPLHLRTPSHIANNFPNMHGIHATCPTCTPLYNSSSLAWLVLASAEGRDFWQQNPRVRALPEVDVETEGRPAIVVPYESVATSARLAGLFDHDTFKLIRIQRSLHD